ncbi:DUF4249 domain-containing protein [Hymenobacter sp. B81]|uniref:DUF4249 domain-containing protein n=1 Tax=Hymenobacter sp. B81 TaxID=3344878 RepID=UPI0037DBF392
MLNSPIMRLHNQLSKTSLLLGGLSVLLSGCETAIDVPEPEHTPRVAVSYVLDNMPGTDHDYRQFFQDREPYVSVSQRLYDTRPLQGRADATVEVRDASGAVVERYEHFNSGPFNQGQYRGLLGYTFQPGQRYQLRVAVPGVETAESELTLPQPVPVAEATLTPRGSNPNFPDEKRARLTVSFDDPAGGADYYLVYARLLDDQGRIIGSLQHYEGDETVSVPRIRLSQSGNYGTVPFSDSGYEGRRITLINEVRYYDNPMSNVRPAAVEVIVSHVTRDLYLFYNSRTVYQDSDGNPFSEPTPLHSNVNAGFGIFGGAADAVFRIPL